jgi:gas vesicle protein
MRLGDRATFFLLGAAIAGTTALLMAPASGRRTRRRLARRGKDLKGYLIKAGGDLVDKYEDLYERTGDLAKGTANGLSREYRTLRAHTKQLRDEAETIFRRIKSAPAYK